VTSDIPVSGALSAVIEDIYDRGLDREILIVA
jgi:hypothetical protein